MKVSAGLVRIRVGTLAIVSGESSFRPFLSKNRFLAGGHGRVTKTTYHIIWHVDLEEEWVSIFG